MKRRSILLDTNLWRYIADAGAAVHLSRVAKAHNARIDVAPSVVYEALRTTDQALRARLVRAMTESSWHRLMPDAYLESLEFLAEVRRLRPQWLRRRPEHAAAQRLLMDWTRKHGGFWDKARRDTDGFAAWIAKGEGPAVDKARVWMQDQRRSLRDAKWSFDKMRFDETTTHFTFDSRRHPPGWRGDALAMWRMVAINGFAVQVHRAVPNNPYREWVLPHVDLDALKSKANAVSWFTFWMYEGGCAMIHPSWEGVDRHARGWGCLRQRIGKRRWCRERRGRVAANEDQECNLGRQGKAARDPMATRDDP
ncbi:MAG TPA: hypothetical protein VMW56_26520, partial [Candidatus Margulisiibacteriota bacterium]|nr:hypothetical protein [Candidatus Margulisiibacteriota bacterium]